MKIYEYSKKSGDNIYHAHICTSSKAISFSIETIFSTLEFEADTIEMADRIIRNHGFELIGKSVSDSNGLTYVQFNVWYYDFEYNEKRVKTFSQIENATQFVTSIVDDSKRRFIELESVY